MNSDTIILIIFLYIILIGGVVTVTVFYLKNLQDLLKEVSDSNRKMPAVNVWLMFIPFFNIVYGFIMYPKISESLRLEFESRGNSQPGDYLKGLGITIPILNICGIIPVLNILAAIGGLVIFIIYWVKSSEMKNILRSTSSLKGTGMSHNEDLLD